MKVFVVAPGSYFGGSPELSVHEVEFHEWVELSNPDWNGQPRYQMVNGLFTDMVNGEVLRDGTYSAYFSFLRQLMINDVNRMYIDWYPTEEQAVDALYEDLCDQFSEDVVDEWLVNNEGYDRKTDLMKFQQAYVGRLAEITPTEDMEVYGEYVFR